MKYSIQALSDSLNSKKFESYMRFLMDLMVRQHPEFAEYFNMGTMPMTQSVEKFITFNDVVAMVQFMKERKDFVIESEIVKDFQNGHHIKQDYGFTLKLPFPIVYINFDDPIDMEMYISQDYLENPSLPEMDYHSWLERRASEKLVKMKDRLYGIIIANDVKTFERTKESTLRVQKEQKTMSDECLDYYKKANPEKTFKVYFILDELRMKNELKDLKPDVADDVEKILKGRDSFDYTNVIFDSEMLPRFISEFGVGVVDMTDRKNNKLAVTLSKLLDITIQIINFINSNDYVEQAPMWKSKKSKEHYESKFARELPPDFYMLRVKYPKEFMVKGEGQPHSPYSYQFDIRGHWRHLRSPRFIHKRGAVIWIPNFKKGHGLYIQKRWIVDSNKNKLTQDHLKAVKTENYRNLRKTKVFKY